MDELIRRLSSMPHNYAAVHIRNTDMQSDYQSQLENLNKKISGPIFVATDDLAALEFAQDLFAKENVFCFSDLSWVEPGKPLHRAKTDTKSQNFYRNRDAILDLLMLALSARLFMIKVSNNRFGDFSGFSVLAKNLSHARPMLIKALGRALPGF